MPALMAVRDPALTAEEVADPDRGSQTFARARPGPAKRVARLLLALSRFSAGELEDPCRVEERFRRGAEERS